MQSFLDEIRSFREFITEIGAGQTALNIPSPPTLSVSYDEDTLNPQALYSLLIIEDEIVSVSRDLFASGHFSIALQEAFKAVEKIAQERTGRTNSGTQLMEQIFSPHRPLLSWSSQSNQSERDEQAGYMRLFSGAMLGIRNPCAHEFNWIDDPVIALEIMVFAQHLARKIKLASCADQKNG